MARYLLYICILAIIFSVAFGEEYNHNDNRNSNPHKNDGHHESWKKAHDKPEEKINNVNTIPNNQQQADSNKPEHNKPNKHVIHHKNAGKAKETLQKVSEQAAPQKPVEQKAPEPVATKKEHAKPIKHANHPQKPKSENDKPSPAKFAKRHEESLDDLAEQDAIGEVLPEKKEEEITKEEIKPEEPKTEERKPEIKKNTEKKKPKKEAIVKNKQVRHSVPAEKTVVNRKSYGNYHHKPSNYGHNHHKQRETQYKFCTFVSLNCSGNAFCLDIETTDCYLLPNGDSMKLYVDAITASALYYLGNENCDGYSPPLYLNQTYTCVPNPLVARSYKIVPGKRIDRFYTKHRKHHF